MTNRTLLSVIVCSRQAPGWDVHQRHVLETVGCPCEYLRIDNHENRYGICRAYNEGISRARGALLIFVHEDVFSLAPGWGRVLVEKFGAHESVGLVGVAGTQYLTANHPAWLAAGEPFLRGHVVHDIDHGRSLYLTVFSREKIDAEVVAVDGLFLAVRSSVFPDVLFDEAAFDHFHFYDLDLCMQIRRKWKLMVTWDIHLKHLSAGHCDASWVEAGKRFLEKYRNELPATCTGREPLKGKKSYGRNYPLTAIRAQGGIDGPRFQNTGGFNQ